jgi:hypothetical protein
MLCQYGLYSKWLRSYEYIFEGLTIVNALLQTAHLNSQLSKLSGRIAAGGGIFENLLETKVSAN